MQVKAFTIQKETLEALLLLLDVLSGCRSNLMQEHDDCLRDFLVFLKWA